MKHPTRGNIREWKEKTQNNDHTMVLLSMAKWVRGTLNDENAATMWTDPARVYHELFAAINTIHVHESFLPQPIAEYRYNVMKSFLRFIECLDPGLHKILNSCL